MDTLLIKELSPTTSYIPLTGISSIANLATQDAGEHSCVFVATFSSDDPMVARLILHRSPGSVTKGGAGRRFRASCHGQHCPQQPSTPRRVGRRRDPPPWEPGALRRLAPHRRTGVGWGSRTPFLVSQASVGSRCPASQARAQDRSRLRTHLTQPRAPLPQDASAAPPWKPGGGPPLGALPGPGGRDWPPRGRSLLVISGLCGCPAWQGCCGAPELPAAGAHWTPLRSAGGQRRAPV